MSGIQQAQSGNKLAFGRVSIAGQTVGAGATVTVTATVANLDPATAPCLVACVQGALPAGMSAYAWCSDVNEVSVGLVNGASESNETAAGLYAEIRQID